MMICLPFTRASAIFLLAAVYILVNVGLDTSIIFAACL